MKRKVGRVIGVICCLVSLLAYGKSPLPAPTTTETESNLLKLSHPYLPKVTSSLPDVSLPLPSAKSLPKKTLTLREAIMLALRSNPDVKSSEIQRIVDKYQVILAKQIFHPQYKLNFTSTLQHSLKPAYSLVPDVSLLLHNGSQFSIDYSNSLDAGDAVTMFSWRQPLIKGYGAVNTVPLYDALTNEKIAKLSFKNNIISSIVGVIASYRRLVQDFNNLAIQKRFLKESAEALRQYQLKVKVGKMAPSDILQQKANYETTKLALVQQQNSLQQDYQVFLSAIGLVPTAHLNIIKKIPTEHYPLPTEQEAIRRALKGNIAYHQALLQLENTRRAIITAQDERKWKLDVTGTETVKNENTGINGLPVTTLNEGESVLFDLEIPIDNVQGKADEVSARVQLEQTKLALEQQKEDLIRQVMTQLQSVRSDWQQIQVSRSAVGLQSATLKAARLKLNYGRSTVFEVTQDQDLLLQQETSLVGTEINYLNDITGLQTIWGNTLDIWNIQLRY